MTIVLKKDTRKMVIKTIRTPATNGGGGAAGSFTFREGDGSSGPSVYGTWSALYAALVEARNDAGGNAHFDIWLDDSVTPTMTIPSGVYDLTGCRLKGVDAHQASVPLVEIVEGAILQNIYYFENLRVVHKGSVTSPITPASADSFTFKNCRLYALAPAAVPFFDASAFADPSPDWFEVILDSSLIGAYGTATPIIDAGGGRCEIRLRGAASFIWDDIVAGSAGSVCTVLKQGSGSNVSFTQPNFAGTFSISKLSTEGARRLYHDPDPDAAAHITNQGSVGNAESGYYRGDASGGPIVFTLVAALSSSSRRGKVVVVRETSGTVGLTVAPSGADLIDGLNASVNVPPGGTITLLCDGVTGWGVVASYDPRVSLATTSNALIFREGAPDTGPVVYGTWAGIMARLTALRAASGGDGVFEIWFDSSTTDPVTIPANPDTTPTAPTSAFTGPTGTLSDRMTLTDSAANFSASDVGRWVNIVNAPTGANNGWFLVTAAPTPSTIEYLNAAGVAEAVGSATYSLTVPHDLSGTALVSLKASNIDVADGATFKGLRRFKGAGFMTVLTSAGSPSAVSDFYGTDEIIVEDGFGINAAGGGSPAVFDYTSAPSGSFLVVNVRDKANIGQNPGGGAPVFHIGLAGQFGIFNVYGQGSIWRNALSSVAGALGFFTIDRGNVMGGQPAWLGNSPTQRVIGAGPKQNVDPVPGTAAATSPVSVSTHAVEVIRCDVSGGGFTQLLPSLPEANGSLGTGGRVTVIEESGNPGLLVDASGANTIDGSGDPVAVPPGGTRVFVNDGDNNWMSESRYSAGQIPSSFVYQPGGTPVGSNVFSDFEELHAAMEHLRLMAGGYPPIEVVIDDTITTPAVISPKASGDWDFHGVTLSGGSTGFNTRLDFADGCTMVGLRKVGSNLGIRSLTTGSLETLAPLSGTSMIVELGFGSFLNQAGGGRFFDGSGIASGDFVQLILADSASLNFAFGGGSGTDAVVYLPDGTFCLLVALNGSSCPSTAIHGTAGSTLFLNIPSMVALPDTLTGFAGTIIAADKVSTPPSLAPVPGNFAAAATASQGTGVRPSQWIRLDATAGEITQPIPAVSSFSNAYKQPGVFFGVTETGGVNGVLLTVQSGDTINGWSGPYLVPPGSSVLMLSDGVSEWTILGGFDADARHQAPADNKTITYYARPGGDDANGGTNDTTDAVATWPRLISLLDKNPPPRTRQVADGTGVDWTIADAVSLPKIMGGQDFDADIASWTGLDTTIFDRSVEYRAHPELVLNVTITNVTVNAADGSVAVTVSETLVVDAHVGQSLVGTGVFEGGTIISNTANVLTVASSTANWTAQARIVTQSSKWTIGDSGNAFSGGLDCTALCTTVFNGIEIDVKTTANKNFILTPLAFVNLALCKIDNILIAGGNHQVVTDYCYFHDTVGVDGGNLKAVSSAFKGVGWNVHGTSAGLTGFDYCLFKDCSPLTTNNSQHSEFSFGLDHCRFDGTRVVVSCPTRTSFDDCYFENVTGDCVTIGYGRGGTVRLNGMTSDSGSCTGWGIKMEHGAQCQIIGGTDLEGTLGQISMGDIEVTYAEVTAAQANNESIDDLDIGAFHSPHWHFSTNATEGWEGGYYDFDSGNNDFSPSVNWGTAGVAYSAHVGFVQGAVSGDQITIRVTGRSVDDLGNETPADTEDVIIAAGAADRYFETSKKWTGQVTIETVAGTPVVFNHGWTKYWDHRNQDFRLRGVEALWESDSAAGTSDIELIHHKATGWTYQAAGGPLNSNVAQRSVDLTDNGHRVGHGAWKRTNLDVDVAGSASEGILFRLTSGSTGGGSQSFRSLNLTVDIRTGLTGQSSHHCRIF